MSIWIRIKTDGKVGEAVSSGWVLDDHYLPSGVTLALSSAFDAIPLSLDS